MAANSSYPTAAGGGPLIIPPFRDAHMHFMLDGRQAAESSLAGIIAAYLQRGIFSLCDRGHRSGIGLRAREAFSERIELTSAGWALFREGGYGSFLGRAIAGVRDIKDAVGEAAASGADALKIINSGVVLTGVVGMVSEGGFSAEELKVLSAEARARGLPVVCHANSDAAVRRALDAGVASIEHGFFVARETLHRMAELGVAWTPTVYAFSRLAVLCPAGEIATIENIIDGHLSSINYAASIGVPLRAGTDSGSKGVAHGNSFIEELRFLKRAGLSLEQVLAAACMEEREIGRGNFLVVARDFIETGAVEAVVYRGKRLPAAPSPETS